MLFHSMLKNSLYKKVCIAIIYIYKYIKNTLRNVFLSYEKTLNPLTVSP